MPDLSLMTHEYFQPLIEQSFDVQNGDQAVAMRVVNVQMLPPPKRRTLSGKMVDVSTARLPFSVFFRSEGETGLGQGTYRMSPPEGGEPIEIFIVPLGCEDGGVVYEAIFT